MARTLRLEVDIIRCDGHGICDEMFPERVSLDDWGYPIVDGAEIPQRCLADARRAVHACPALALRLVEE